MVYHLLAGIFHQSAIPICPEMWCALPVMNSYLSQINDFTAWLKVDLLAKFEGDVLRHSPSLNDSCTFFQKKLFTGFLLLKCYGTTQRDILRETNLFSEDSF
jgi:hypothetical protein